MSSSLQSIPDSASAAVHALPANGAWSSEFDDVAFGCECADPSLQIASWGQDSAEPMQAGGVAT
jgi:hypothetical protein